MSGEKVSDRVISRWVMKLFAANKSSTHCWSPESLALKVQFSVNRRTRFRGDAENAEKSLQEPFAVQLFRRHLCLGSKVKKIKISQKTELFVSCFYVKIFDALKNLLFIGQSTIQTSIVSEVCRAAFQSLFISDTPLNATLPFDIDSRNLIVSFKLSEFSHFSWFAACRKLWVLCVRDDESK